MNLWPIGKAHPVHRMGFYFQTVLQNKKGPPGELGGLSVSDGHAQTW